jgi:hypothetical protein
VKPTIWTSKNKFGPFLGLGGIFLEKKPELSPFVAYKVEKTPRFSQSFGNVAKMWFFTKRGFVQKWPFRDGAEKRPKFTNCAHKATGKACICHIDEGMNQHPSRVSHSFHPCTAAVAARRRRCKYASSVHRLTRLFSMLEHIYAFEPLFSFTGHF